MPHMYTKHMTLPPDEMRYPWQAEEQPSVSYFAIGRNHGAGDERNCLLRRGINSAKDCCCGRRRSGPFRLTV